DDPRIAMIFPEDIEVALILAFLEDPQKPVRPSFSLDPSLGSRNRDPRVDRIDKKDFRNAPWLTGTDFGRTFYWTDYLMKRMTGALSFPSMYDVFKNVAYNLNDLAKRFPDVLVDFERRGFEDREDGDKAITGRLMLTLDSVELSSLGSSVA